MMLTVTRMMVAGVQPSYPAKVSAASLHQLPLAHRPVNRQQRVYVQLHTHSTAEPSSQFPVTS